MVVKIIQNCPILRPFLHFQRYFLGDARQAGIIKAGARGWPVHLQRLFVIVYSATLLKVAPIHIPGMSATIMLYQF